MSILNGIYTRSPDDAKCNICKRIFCCGKCRQKHKIANHAIAVNEPLAVTDQYPSSYRESTSTIYIFCPICERKPLVLRDELYMELLDHIENEHLPLHCRKCLKNYTKIDDLREFSKCADMEQNCSTSSCNTEEASKVTVKKIASSTISTQTSPAVTPISLINLHWKAKSRYQHQQLHQQQPLQEEFICSDSVSSIRNLSSFSNSNFSLRRSIGQFTNPNPPEPNRKGKVIRSTSTPLQVDYSMFPKPKETVTFNASSLYHEELPSPATLDANPIQQHQRAWKGSVGSAAVGRNKITAVTPLRQVMSKSIQKAFVEHGGIMSAVTSTAAVPPPNLFQGRLRFDLSENNSAGSSSALDLRLSPAMRRSQSESSSSTSRADPPELGQNQRYRQQILMSAQKLTTESIIITRNSHEGSTECSTVYNSCESVEIIQTTSQSSEVHHHPPITPITRIPGAMINKKLIKFETPVKQEKLFSNYEPEDQNNKSSKDMFYTPNPESPNDKFDSQNRRPHIVPRQLSGQFSPRKGNQIKEILPALEPPPDRPRRRPPLRECQAYKSFSGIQDISVMSPTNRDQDNLLEETDEEVFLPINASTRNDKKTDQGLGRLWSIMSTVIRLPSSREKDDKENRNPNPKPQPLAGGSLLRRCASIAGSFVRSRTEGNDDADMQTLKRKRTQTLDSHQYGTNGSPLSPGAGSSSKRYRIQPRRPIDRMRHHT